MDESDPMYDRLMLSRERIEAIAADIKNVASLPTPVGETLGKTVRPNGMVIRKVRVPFGVIGVIYVRMSVSMYFPCVSKRQMPVYSKVGTMHGIPTMLSFP